MTSIILLFICSTSYGQSLTYKKLPNAKERAASRSYQRFPGWEETPTAHPMIEIIQDGNINQDLAALLLTDDWHPDVSLNKLRWLQVRELDIEVDALERNEDNDLVVPFIVGIRFQEIEKNITNQGTINTSGTLQISTDENGLLQIKLTSFDDSWAMERLGRSLKNIDQYDEAFVKGVAIPILDNYLKTHSNEYAEPLMNLLP